MALVLDSGVLYALLDRLDARHRECRALVTGSDERVVIPSPILAEVDYFITERLQPRQRMDLLEDIRSGDFAVEDLLADDYDRVYELCLAYSNVGFVDAAVLAIEERLNEAKLATLDHRHFGMMRPRHVSALTLLP